MVHFTWLEDWYTRSTNQETLTAIMLGWIIAKPRSPLLVHYCVRGLRRERKWKWKRHCLLLRTSMIWRNFFKHGSTAAQTSGKSYLWPTTLWVPAACFTQKEIWMKRDAAAYRTYLDDNCPASMHIYVGWYEQRVANDSPGIRTTSWDKNIPCTLCISAEGEEARRTKQRPGTKK